MKLFNKAFASLVILGALWAGGAQAALVKPGFGPSFPDFNLSFVTFYIGSDAGLLNGQMGITVADAIQFTDAGGTDHNASLLATVAIGPMTMNAAGDVLAGGAWSISGSVDTLATNELLLSGTLTKFGNENSAGDNWTVDATSTITGGALSAQYASGEAYFLFPSQNFAASSWDGSWVGNGGQTDGLGNLDITTPKLIEVPVVPALWLMVPGLLLMLRKSKKA